MTLKDRLANARAAGDLFSQIPSANRRYNKLIAEIAVKIKKERLSRDLTQKEFADFMSVTQGMISRWESAEYNFPLRNICEIFDKLGVNFSIRFDEQDEKIKHNQMTKYDINPFLVDNIYHFLQQGSLNFEIAQAG